MRLVHENPIITLFQANVGMTAEITANRADIASTILAQCCGREQVFDYTTAISEHYHIATA